MSIIIVSYNEKQYLSMAIESCLMQDFREPFEIIIGDDGSDDGSIDLIKEYVDKYPEQIKYFVMDRTDAVNVIPSVRVSNVLKKGFAISSGQYLMVMSADDYICDNQKWKIQTQFLDLNPDYVSCYTDYKKFWDIEKEQNYTVSSSMNNVAFWSMRYMHISCFVFSKKVIPYVLERFCDDTGLIFSVLKAGKSKHISGVMFGYRQRDKSIMHEADKLELNILEVALLQDVKNQGGYYLSTLSRFAKPIIYLYNHRKQLLDEKYEKYIMNCKQYPNDYLGMIRDYINFSIWDKIKILGFLFVCTILYLVFYPIRKIDIFFHVLFKL